jgi:biopolymer transport protein ExbD
MQVNPFPFKRPVRVEMVPLIDMFFLVLTFFIFGVFSMTMQQGILVDLPRAATAASTREEAVTVSVAPDGSFFVNTSAVAPDRLADVLRQERSAHPDALVIINADRASAHGTVITALDAVRASGFQRISFQTERDQ